MKILNIGPSISSSKGGMAEVIKSINDSIIVGKEFNVQVYSSYIEGNKIKRLFYSVFSFCRFILIYKKYDLYHIHISTAGSVYRKILYIRFLKKKNKKVILHFHSGSFPSFFDRQSNWKKNYILESLNKVDSVIVLSEKWKDLLSKIIAVEKIDIINNGIITNDFLKSTQKDFREVNKKFLFLGRVTEKKGIYDLVKAFSKLTALHKDAKLLIAGDGDLHNLNEVIKSYNLENNVIILGWIGLDKKIEVLKEVGTVVLPSYYEGFPMTIIEGMAARTAIISTKVGSIPEIIIDEENGFLGEPGDVDFLANSMSKICEAPPLCQKFADKNVYKASRNYDLKIVHQDLTLIYKRISLV